jgi:ubiquinone biosynthesis protein
MRTYKPPERGKEADPAVAIAGLLKLSSWIPLERPEWHALMKALFEDFLRHFERGHLARLLDEQRKMPASTPPADRAVRLASELTALHKVCQMLARNPAVPAEARAALAPLERLPPEAIPEAALTRAVGLAKRERPALRPDATEPKIGRGSVADVFRFSRPGPGTAVAFKAVRVDALSRIRSEAAILMKMANEAANVATLVGPDFARTIVEALRDAARALLREIDFAGEAANLRDARAFYRLNDRVRVPVVEGAALEEGIFMEFVEGSPLLETPLDADERREAARLLFRSLFLEPLFSGIPESIFHADPHAGNILAQREKNGDLTLVLLDWSQADRLPAALRHAIVELCLHCATGSEPPDSVIQGILERPGEIGKISLPGEGDPLHKAFKVVEQLAVEGHRLPLSLLLLRKSFLTLDGIARQLDPSFAAWREALLYTAWVLASEAPMRVWSLPFPWYDQSEFYRSGLPTRTLASVLLQTCYHHALKRGFGTC